MTDLGLSPSLGDYFLDPMHQAMIFCPIFHSVSVNPDGKIEHLIEYLLSTYCVPSTVPTTECNSQCISV